MAKCTHFLWMTGHTPERERERESINAAMAEVSERIAAIGSICEPDTSWVLHDVDEQRKRSLLCQHSEKLALCMGSSITTLPGTPLIIVKNLRMCDDCHNATKYIAKVIWSRN